MYESFDEDVLENVSQHGVYSTVPHNYGFVVCLTAEKIKLYRDKDGIWTRNKEILKSMSKSLCYSTLNKELDADYHQRVQIKKLFNSK